MADERGAMEKALENPLILQNIFRHLSTSDLLPCRIVNRLNWFDLATEILREKEHKICFDPSSLLASGKYNAALKDSSENPWSLKSLTICIKESRYFPCVRFRFSGQCFEDEDFLEFFSVCGESIIELELDLIAKTNVNNTIENFGQVLWKQLPNLDKLTIWKLFLGWSAFSRLFLAKVRPLVKLPNLKYLNFEKSLGNGNFKFIQDIQDAAPNLQNVQQITFVPPKPEQKSKFIDFKQCLSKEEETKMEFPNLTFSPQQPWMNFYEKLWKTKTKFSGITVNLRKARETPEVLSKVPGMLSEFLELNQSSLRHLDGIVDILSLPELQLNRYQLPHVEELTLKTPGKSCPTRLFIPFHEENPPDASALILDSISKTWTTALSRSFPSLSTMQVDCLNLLQYAESSIQTVQTFKSDAVFCSDGEFENVAKVFPMVTKLELKNIMNFQDCAGSIWEHFVKLTHLHIGILIAEQEKFSINDAFLGISEQNENVSPKKMKKSSSILKLADLKSLHLSFIRIPKDSDQIIVIDPGNWTNWSFLDKFVGLLTFPELKQLKSIHLTVASDWLSSPGIQEIEKQLDCIMKQLRALRQFTEIRVGVIRKKKN